MKYATAVLVLLLAGCAASAQTRSASVNIGALLPKHPLYGTLAQYDRQIASLESTLHTQFADSGAQIANARAAVRRDLSDAANAAQNYQNTRVTDEFSHNIIVNSPRGSGAPSAGQIESNIQRAYQQQHAELQGTAQRDMDQYRASLLAQQQSAYNAFVQSVNDRMQRAYNARAQELREKEGALLLEYARKYASQRLILRAKLQTLALREPVRRRFQAQLAALQDNEYAALHKMQAADARILAAYSSSLRARTDGDIAKMQAELQARTNANLAARERVLAAQTSTSGTLQLPSSHARAGSAADMQAQYNSLLHAQPADTAAFTNARGDLASKFKALYDTDAANTASIQSQIRSLQHDREAVRKRMIAQIMLEARQEAKARGLSGVSEKYRAEPGSVDLTSSVAADLKALSP